MKLNKVLKIIRSIHITLLCPKHYGSLKWVNLANMLQLLHVKMKLHKRYV